MLTAKTRIMAKVALWEEKVVDVYTIQYTFTSDWGEDKSEWTFLEEKKTVFCFKPFVKFDTMF